ncbi:unnamed protein product [Kluyveromyces dobzhanskii CBS 2104]|uniref:WGS project CCBQ000000000 data, contig 00104 n=1 Tax=Kluyveromyces dobzhanskii CBS 2104 TaxID=1427455 RepID=A0A0A8L645_9SACH|nr:unnamed protein product [Kluyveromyces dobzhanskii CBS 2104]
MFDAKIKDEISVVSNNSTSVFPDICQPLDITEEDNTVKYKPPIEVDSPESAGSSESYDDDYNVRFLPRLRSKHSIVQLSQPSTPKKSALPPRRKQLKEKLGEPLPLPYLDPQRKPEVSRDLDSRWNSIISNAKARQTPRKISETEIPLQKSSFELPRTISNTVHPSTGANRLEFQLENTSEKLDQLIELLQNRTAPIDRSAAYEPLIWLICIIILVLCNVCVYHYL